MNNAWQASIPPPLTHTCSAHLALGIGCCRRLGAPAAAPAPDAPDLAASSAISPPSNPRTSPSGVTVKVTAFEAALACDWRCKYACIEYTCDLAASSATSPPSTPCMAPSIVTVRVTAFEAASACESRSKHTGLIRRSALDGCMCQTGSMGSR
eukprot:1156182-Pelagomonas_calceolata.AAC.5